MNPCLLQETGMNCE